MSVAAQVCNGQELRVTYVRFSIDFLFFPSVFHRFFIGFPLKHEKL